MIGNPLHLIRHFSDFIKNQFRVHETHQSCGKVDGFTNRQQFSKGIIGGSFNFIPSIDPEI